MIISLNRPITGFDKKYSFATLASLLALIATLIIVSEAYRIFMKSSDLLFFLRTSEDFFLIFIIFFMIALKGRLQLQNLAPFSFLMIYGYLSFSLDYNTDFLRQYALFMFWYTVAINTIYGTKSSVLVVIICSIGIVSGISMITDTERPLVSYMFGGRRIHAEGEGLEMNINNISLALIAIVACTSVLEKKFGITRFSKILTPSLFLVTGIILMLGQTRSALLFFFLLIIYRFFSFSLRSAFLLGLISVIICFYIILYFDQFLLIFDQFLLIFRFSDYDYGNSQRLVAILNSLEAFSYSPLNGVGDEKLLKMQMLENGATDHNFYTKLLGSHGLIGLTFVMFFFYGIIKRSTKNTQGLIILQLFFLYSFVFAPSGPGCILIATIIFYINEYDRTEKFKQLPIRYH